jgi:hypothetical protein
MTLKQEQQKKSPLQLFQERTDSPLELLEEVRKTKIGKNGLTFEDGLDKIIENFRKAEFEFKKTNSFKQLQTAPSFVAKSWFQERIETLYYLSIFDKDIQFQLGQNLNLKDLNNFFTQFLLDEQTKNNYDYQLLALRKLDDGERLNFLENKETLETFFEVLEVFSQSVEVVLGLDENGNLSIESDDFKDKKGEFITSQLLAPLSTDLEESFAYTQPFSAAFFTTLLTGDKSYLYERMVEIAHNAIKMFKLEDEEKG